ncbi:hypothetical protein [Streptomyces sp. NPDC001880]
MRRAVRRAAESPAAEAATAGTPAPEVTTAAAEPFAVGAVAAAVAVVIVLAITGMVAQLFPEPQRNRTTDTEGHEERLTRAHENGEGSCEGRGAP